MKTGKELKINTSKNYNIIIGSVNNKQPKAVYLNVSAWGDPQDEDSINYSRLLKDLNKRIKQNLYNYFDGDDDCIFVKDRTIVDLDIRESGIRYGKRSFMNCEITLFLISETPINSEPMKHILNSVINDIVIKTFEDTKTFKFHKKKH